jgi:hypothetical protein
VPVLAKKTELRCKLCRHERRAEIDALLELRSLRRKDEAGVLVTLAVVLAQLAEWGVENPTEDNVKGHWKNHCEQVSEQQVADDTAQREDIIAKLLAGELDHVNVDEYLRLIVSVNHYELVERVKKGEKTGVTIDHSLKAIDGLTKRRHSDATADLFRAIGGAVAQAVGGGKVQGELTAADEDVIEDGEVLDG